MNKMKIDKLMRIRLAGIEKQINFLTKKERESLLLEHLEWLEGGWEKEEILFLKISTNE